MPLFLNNNQGFPISLQKPVGRQQHGLVRLVTVWCLLADDAYAQALTLRSPPPAEVARQRGGSPRQRLQVLPSLRLSQSSFPLCIITLVVMLPAWSLASDLVRGSFTPRSDALVAASMACFGQNLLYILFGADLILSNFPFPVKEPCARKQQEPSSLRSWSIQSANRRGDGVCLLRVCHSQMFQNIKHF